MWCRFAEGWGGGVGVVPEDLIIFKSTHKSRTKTSLIFIAITLAFLQKRKAKLQLTREKKISS